jgi:DNA-binding LacI/PurR family transcriptional regulator
MATTIGALLLSTRSIFHFGVLQGVQEYAAQRDVAVRVFETRAAQPSLDELRVLDGVLTIANSVSDALLRAIYAVQLPLILVAHRLPDLPIPRCVADNIQGMETLARHVLIECGRRSPLFLRGLVQQHDGRQRELAFRQVLANIRLALPETYFLRGDFDPQRAAESLRAFIASGGAFDAIISADYAMALAALDVLQAAGLQVPQQAMLACFGDSPEVQAAGITAVSMDMPELGKCALENLLCLIEGMPVPAEITLPNILHKRRTTCS